MLALRREKNGEVEDRVTGSDRRQKETGNREGE